MPMSMGMENPVFLVSEGPDLDMASPMPAWTIPIWFHSKDLAEAHWARVQVAADRLGRGLYPNQGVRVVPMAEAIEARQAWIESTLD